MSTTVTLDRVWLHDAADLADAIGLRHRPLEGTASTSARVGVYAGGRRRLIVAAGDIVEPLELDVVRMSRAAYWWLHDRLGELLLLRDPHGRRVWGAVLELPWREWPTDADHLAGVSFRFVPLTHDETV